MVRVAAYESGGLAALSRLKEFETKVELQNSNNVSLLEAEEEKTRQAIDIINMSLRILEPIPFSSVLPLERLLIREKTDVVLMSEADLLQEISNVEIGLIRIDNELGDTSSVDHLDVKVARIAHELAAISQRDVGIDEDAETLYCICRLPYNGTRLMLQCDVCQDWFHLTCVGVAYADAETSELYECPVCVGSVDNNSDVDLALVRCGDSWLEIEIRAIEYELVNIVSDIRRVDASIKRIRMKESALLKAKAAEKAASLARKQALEKKKTQKQRSSTQSASGSVANVSLRRSSLPLRSSSMGKDASSVVPAKKLGEHAEKFLMGGEELRAEIMRVMSEYGVTQTRLAIETQISGGASSISAIIRRQPVHRRKQKESILSSWLASAYQRIADKTMMKTEKLKVEYYETGDQCDAKATDGLWRVAVILATGKGRVKVCWGESNLRDSWLGIKGTRIALLGTHTTSLNTNTRARMLMRTSKHEQRSSPVMTMTRVIRIPAVSATKPAMESVNLLMTIEPTSNWPSATRAMNTHTNTIEDIEDKTRIISSEALSVSSTQRVPENSSRRRRQTMTSTESCMSPKSDTSACTAKRSRKRTPLQPDRRQSSSKRLRSSQRLQAKENANAKLHVPLAAQ